MNPAELATFAERRRRLAEAVGRRHRHHSRPPSEVRAQRRHPLRVPAGLRLLLPDRLRRARRGGSCSTPPTPRSATCSSCGRATARWRSGTAAAPAWRAPSRRTARTPRTRSTSSTQKLREYAIDRPALFYRARSAPALRRQDASRLLEQLRGRARARRRAPDAHRGPEPDRRTRCGCGARPPSSRGSAAPARSAATRHIEAMRYAAARACTSTRCRPRSSSCSAPAARRGTRYPSIVASGPNACILHYNENRAAHGGRRPPADRRRLRVRLPLRRHHAHVPGERPLHARPARDLRGGAPRPARRHRGAPARARRYEAVHDAARRVLTEGLVAPRAPAPRRRRVARHASLPRVLHARHRALARHGRARRGRLPDPRRVAACSSPAWCSPWSPGSTSIPSARR